MKNIFMKIYLMKVNMNNGIYNVEYMKFYHVLNVYLPMFKH